MNKFEMLGAKIEEELAFYRAQSAKLEEDAAKALDANDVSKYRACMEVIEDNAIRNVMLTRLSLAAKSIDKDYIEVEGETYRTLPDPSYEDGSDNFAWDEDLNPIVDLFEEEEE